VLRPAWTRSPTAQSGGRWAALQVVLYRTPARAAASAALAGRPPGAGSLRVRSLRPVTARLWASSRGADRRDHASAAGASEAGGIDRHLDRAHLSPPTTPEACSWVGSSYPRLQARRGGPPVHVSAHPPQQHHRGGRGESTVPRHCRRQHRLRPPLAGQARLIAAARAAGTYEFITALAGG
jgi:hypothetical protein